MNYMFNNLSLNNQGEIAEIQQLLIKYKEGTLTNKLLQFFNINIEKQYLNLQLQKYIALLDSSEEIVHFITINHIKQLLILHNEKFILQDYILLFNQIPNDTVKAIIVVLAYLTDPRFSADILTSSPTLILDIIREMNPETSQIKHFFAHRKTAIQFRDNHLKDLFISSYNQFKQTVPQKVSETWLQVLSVCLSFDFLGTVDNHGMNSAIQIPTSWRDLVFNNEMMDFLYYTFENYKELASPVLECIEYLMGCRRSLFVETERIEYLKHSLGIAVKILRSTNLAPSFYNQDMKKLDESEIYMNEFLQYCLKYFNFATITELVFIIQIWVQLRETEHLFFVTNLSSVQQFLLMFINLPVATLELFYFDDAHAVEQLLPCLGKLVRTSNYPFMANGMMSRFNEDGKRAEYLGTCWIIGLANACLSHRIAYQATEEEDKVDGFIIGTIFQYLDFKPIQTVPNQNEQLVECAVFSLMEQFKQVYLVGDGSTCPQMWQAVASQAQITSQHQILLKIIPRIVHTCKLLQSKELKQFVRECGIFEISVTVTTQQSKSIMILYECISKLYLSDHYNESTDTNLQQILSSLARFIDSNSFDITQIHLLIRKLRGISMSVFTTKLYKILFDWLLPRFPKIKEYLQLGNLELGNNILKFMKELTRNKANRLNFETCGEYGVLLFRETVSLIITIFTQLEPEISNANDPSPYLKPIYITFEILKNLISSKATPFGILKFYREECLPQMVQIVFTLSSRLSPPLLLEYNKLGFAYFSVWVCMTGEYMPYLLPDITETVLNQLLMNCFKVIENHDNSTSTQAAVIVNQIFSKVHSDATHTFFSLNVESHAHNFCQLLFYRLFNFELDTQWSLTRPFLPVILFNVDYFHAYTSKIISIQTDRLPSETSWAQVLYGIMKELEYDLNVRTRDKFTNNVDNVRRSLKSLGVSLIFDDFEYN
ncbi:Ran-binding protein 17 [Terramyces sp. JEL0728]|nr:Ran-binding protein 17 [Terramyces sp. JEL0728]